MSNPERNTMIEFTPHIDLHRPTHEVFAFVLDFANAPKWNYYVTNVKKQTSGPIRVGTIFHQSCKTDQQHYQITQLTPGRSVDVTTTPGSSPASTRRFELNATPSGTQLHDHW
jgi:Polyketide cyclase / dehydrase and lipid transport